MTSDAAGEARKTTAPGDVHRLTDPVDAGDPLLDVGLEGRVGEVGCGAVGPDERRGDGVDRDAVAAPLDREAARQVGDGGLADAVDRLGREGDEAGLRAEVDDPPVPWRIITRPAAWLAKKTPLTLTSNVRSKSASVTSSAGFAGPRPALLTRMSSRPNSSTTRSTAARIWSSRRTSIGTRSERRPIARISGLEVLGR